MKYKKEGLFILVFAFVLASILIVSAEVDFSNVDVLRSYGPGQLLEGSFNLEFEEEPITSELLITLEKDGSKINKSISILDFLKNSNANYSCDPVDCEANFTKQNSLARVNIVSGEEFIGLLVKTGNDTEIRSLSFKLNSSATGGSCGVPPISLDILNDGIVDWRYNEASDDFCDSLKSSSTYNESQAAYDYKLGEEPYCEKIRLKKGGRFKIGIDMKNATPETPIIMSLNDLEFGESEECELIAGDGIRTCEVNYTVFEEKNYYICAQSFEEANYKIKGEDEGLSCGKIGLEEFDCTDSVIDYAIYSQSAEFKVLNEEEVFDQDSFNEFNPEDLTVYLQNYIDKKYKSDCDAGCLIPIKISSTQDAEIYDLDFRYYSPFKGERVEEEFYEIEKREATIDLEITEMQLSKADFKVPSKYGGYDLSVYIGDERLRETSIRIEKVPIIKSITPVSVFAAIDTEFTVEVESPKDNLIVEYTWDFGDGGSELTFEPRVTYSYPSGNYVLTLSAMDDEGLIGQRSFDIITMQPKEAVNLSIEAKRENLKAMLIAIEGLPEWYKDLVKEGINLEKIGSDLSSFEDEFLMYGADYADIKIALDEFVVYSGINDEEGGLAVVPPTINLDLLRGMGEKIDVGKEEETKRNIESWSAASLNLEVKSVVKVAESDIGDENDLDLATLFEIRLSPKEDLIGNEIYLIVEVPGGFSYEDFRFKENVTPQKLEVAWGIKLDGVESERIEFALPGRVDVSELKIFASPTIQGLVQPDVYCGNNICDKSFGEDSSSCPQDCKPIGKLITWIIFILIIVAGGIYFIWKYYTVMYEKDQIKKLFNKEADFYNLSFFISNESNKGTKELRIRTLLEKAGWKEEQIQFGLNKVKEQTKRMQKQSILNFVTGELKSGKRIPEVRLKLGRAGWDVLLINWAIKKAKNNIIRK